MTTSPSSGPKDIDALTLQTLLSRGEAVLIDVREREEFEEERIPGAILIPMSSFDPGQVASTASDRQIVLSCLTGSRSEKAAALLAAHGLGNTLTLRDGLLGWKGAGLPTDRDGR